MELWIHVKEVEVTDVTLDFGGLLGSSRLLHLRKDLVYLGNILVRQFLEL